MPRPQRKAAIDAKEKLTTNGVGPRETRDSLGKEKKDAAEPSTKANAHGGAAAAAAAGAGVENIQPAKTAAALTREAAKPKIEPEMEELPSEERSGDQPVVEDDATTAPVPDRVSECRVALSYSRAAHPRAARFYDDSRLT